ncbi:LIC_10190 family membrane protein [Candidatus Pelagibacter sp. HIMB1748]|uniref:LIC_10190 family membrane protein n=1 Tax=unclassified Candidatus Pelagibacter TaxID=2647897 RepID=UPI003F84EE6B
MLESYLSTLFLLFCIFGYAAFLKKILNGSKKIYNIDFIYGLLFLTIIAIFLNLFFPLKYFSLLILLTGFIIFIRFFWTRSYQFNLNLLLLVSLFVVFISHGQGISYDSQLYHLQILQQSLNNKSIFGIGNLQPHYAMNSSWHSMLGILNLKLIHTNFIYLANLVLLIILINESLIKFLNKNKLLSNYFLLLSVLYILFYSMVHPYGNGTMLNSLGSPEVDIPAAILFLITIYLLITYHEKKDKDLLKLILISSFLVVTIKISYIGIILVTLYTIFYIKKNFFLYDKINWILFFGCIFWLFKSFIYSGCFIFPISFTCTSFFWSVDINDVKSYSYIVQSFARDTPLRLNFTNFDYTLNSWQWFFPWIKEYFLKTEFLFVSFLLVSILTSYFVFLFIHLKYKLIVLKKNFYFHLYIILIINILIWMRAPEIRFGYGSIISLTCFCLAILLFKNSKKNLFNKKILWNYIILVTFVSLTFKNINNFKSFSDISFVRNFENSNFKNIYNTNGYRIYQPSDNFCNNFEGFCTYQGFKVNVEKKGGYVLVTRKK